MDDDGTARYVQDGVGEAETLLQSRGEQSLLYPARASSERKTEPFPLCSRSDSEARGPEAVRGYDARWAGGGVTDGGNGGTCTTCPRLKAASRLRALPNRR